MNIDKGSDNNVYIENKRGRKLVDCKECNNSFCEFRKHLNEVKYTQCICSEFIKQRLLNEDIADFFYKTNERFKQC